MPDNTIRFFQTADLHLGAKFGNLPSAVASLKRQSQRESLTFLVDQALERKVDLFLICGDLFDTVKPDYSDVVFAKAELERLPAAGIKTFLIPGNHDHYAPNNFWDQYAPWPVHHFFKSYEFEAVMLPKLNLEVVGIGFDRAHSSTNQLKKYALKRQASYSILLYHGAWQNFGRELTKDYPFDSADLEKLEFNYIALGHYHARSEVLTAKQQKAVYAGSPEGLDFSKGELGSRYGIYGLIDTEGVVTLNPIEVPSMVMQKLELDASSVSLAGVDQAVLQHKNARNLMQLVLTGLPSKDLLREFPRLEQHYSELFAFFEFKDETIGLPTDFEQDAHTYQGLFYQAISERLSQAKTPEEKSRLRQALAIGLAAFAN